MKLYLILAISLIVSCAKIEKPIYLKCKVPEIPKTELEKIKENASYPEKLETILNNCLKIKRENELLRSALDVCK